MQTAILVLHVIVCAVLIMLVLLQAGREGMGVIFGGELSGQKAIIKLMLALSKSNDNNYIRSLFEGEYIY